MTSSHCSYSIAAALLVALTGAPSAQAPAAPPVRQNGATVYTVFLGQRALGREELSVLRQADGWVFRGTSQIGPPVDIVTRKAEVRYDAEWHPRDLTIEGTVRGQEANITTTFADGQATNAIDTGGAQPEQKVDPVAADTIVLPNAFLGSYAALSHRLAGAEAGATFRAYLAPQSEIGIRLDAVATEYIDTPKQRIAATRYALRVMPPEPRPAVQVSLWADATGALLRLSVPAQMLEMAREDIASVATRTSAFALPGDETVHIPAAGFNLGATITRPAGVSGPLPAIVLVGGSGPTDRDGYAFGVPVLGEMAKALVEAGFIVVRYDKRGVGQSGGRTEIATLTDYAEDVRAILDWLDDREDVDDDRIGLVGHSEGAWVSMLVADKDDEVASLVLVAAGGTTGADLILEQQRHALEQAKTPEADMQAKIALQQRINEATLTGDGWEGIPAQLRRAADTPWFQSLLAFDPAKVMKDLRQPILIVQGSLDTQVPPANAEKLAELARARRRKTATDLAIVPGINHLLVPATTGEVSEYASLGDVHVSPAVTAAIGEWFTRTLARGK
jgi:pimeloyl-ACP methyl ester carboxylesterase